MIEGLEVAAVEPPQLRRLEVYVPAATNWISVAGHDILGWCRRELDTGEDTVPMWIGQVDGGDSLWLGTSGFDMNRWEFWKTRFAEIAQLPAAKAVVDSASRAAAEMQHLEDGDLSCSGETRP